MYMNRQKGFTLIELLVVIAVIGVLAAVILASLNSARAKGRDAKRLSDLKQVQIALELYYDTFNAYPDTGNNWWGNCSSFLSKGTTGASAYIPNLAPTYIPELPLDPRQTNGNCYLYRSTTTDYMFLVYGTVEGTVPSSLIRPLVPAEKDYAIYTPGARMW